jgi:hypothetical protein
VGADGALAPTPILVAASELEPGPPGRR